jgi:hypothetical protein
LRDHACHRALHSDGDAARETEENDEENGFHEVVLGL